MKPYLYDEFRQKSISFYEFSEYIEQCYLNSENVRKNIHFKNLKKNIFIISSHREDLCRFGILRYSRERGDDIYYINEFECKKYINKIKYDWLKNNWYWILIILGIFGFIIQYFLKYYFNIY
jgi:hypothetical protein